MVDFSQPELTDATLRAALAGSACLACRASKRPGHVFCPACWALLTLPMRWSLDNRDPVRFLDAARAALGHARANQGSRPAAETVLTPNGPLRWRYRTTQELEAAGYLFAGHARCAVPRCWAPIVWYWTPNRKRMAINPADCRPHSASCCEPGYFQRKREEKLQKRRLQTIARKKRARA